MLLGSIPIDHVLIRHHQLQQPVLRDCPLFKRYEWLVFNQAPLCVLSNWWHKSISIIFVFVECHECLLNAKKTKTMFVSTCVTKWKAPNV